MYCSVVTNIFILKTKIKQLQQSRNVTALQYIEIDS